MRVHATEPTAERTPRQTVGVSAATVRTEFLDRSMEATALNLRQFDPSPEIDSDLERALEANSRGDKAAVRRWILAAIEANHLEGRENLAISGTADRLAADLENGATEAPGIKRLCRELRPILKTIMVGDPVDCAAAVREFRHIRVRVGVTQLAAPGVRRELGKKLSTVLEGLI